MCDYPLFDQESLIELERKSKVKVWIPCLALFF